MTDDKYTKSRFQYNIIATKACSTSQGGAALVYCNSFSWHLEGVQCFDLNVIHAMLVENTAKQLFLVFIFCLWKKMDLPLNGLNRHVHWMIIQK